jgi:hypothetical protein
MSLRLNPHDIAVFIGHFSIDGDENFDPGSIIKKGQTVESRNMLRAACEAVSHFRTLDNHRSRLREILDPESHKLLDREHDVSYIEQAVRSKWAVVAHISGEHANAALQNQRPSFFVNWSGALGFESQIHVIDTPVYNVEDCMLITCSREPSSSDTHNMLVELGEKLGTSSADTDWVTEPFQNKDDGWFRADGILEMRFKDRVIFPNARSALGHQKAGALREGTLLFVDPDSDIPQDSGTDSDTESNEAPQARPKWTWVIWTRQSNEDGSKARTTIPLQLTTLISSELLLLRQPGDRICVFIESSSSNRHPWADRSLPYLIPRDRPIHMLTVNPDRITRRAEEIPKVLDLLDGGVWYDHHNYL